MSLFVKLQIAPLQTGFLAALRPEDWHTLTALASFMDRDRRCYPSLRTLARCLNISVSAVQARLHRLTTLQWQGQPVLTIEHQRQPNGRWSRNIYRIGETIPLHFGPAAPADADATASHISPPTTRGRSQPMPVRTDSRPPATGTPAHNKNPQSPQIQNTQQQPVLTPKLPREPDSGPASHQPPSAVVALPPSALSSATNVHEAPAYAPGDEAALDAAIATLPTPERQRLRDAAMQLLQDRLQNLPPTSPAWALARMALLPGIERRLYRERYGPPAAVSPPDSAVTTPETPKTPETPNAETLLSALAPVVGRGQAQRWMARYGLERVAAVYTWSQTAATVNRGGWMRRALEGEWEPPATRPKAANPGCVEARRRPSFQVGVDPDAERREADRQTDAAIAALPAVEAATLYAEAREAVRRSGWDPDNPRLAGLVQYRARQLYRERYPTAVAARVTEDVAWCQAAG